MIYARREWEGETIYAPHKRPRASPLRRRRRHLCRCAYVLHRCTLFAMHICCNPAMHMCAMHAMRVFLVYCIARRALAPCACFAHREHTLPHISYTHHAIHMYNTHAALAARIGLYSFPLNDCILVIYYRYYFIACTRLLARRCRRRRRRFCLTVRVSLALRRRAAACESACNDLAAHARVSREPIPRPRKYACTHTRSLITSAHSGRIVCTQSAETYVQNICLGYVALSICV